MQCQNCGQYFKTTGHGRKPQYCSDKCRVDANRKRKQNGTKKEEIKQPVVINLPTKSVKTSVQAEDLTKETFERMCDASVLEELRYARDILHKAMISPDTPANALPAISKELISITEKIEGMSDSTNPLSALETEAVTNDTFDATTI
ncbi:DUF6076 domain-containing protein [Gardnerella vaginalis]|uniref:DUF6076 domain-containing protein n=1 Tax=Gardnerella vaginalis TaxID=2702 RepID=UPI00200E677C|nr:DUF6076 domain-containing protein [Gardnerella vaginalis]UQA84498.1 DUF6076 domain-containing protein [Gardnerella vaginalis]DAY37355.1 MAG TPA: DNA gyrase inhibitor [Caudoviricetes sp.]